VLSGTCRAWRFERAAVLEGAWLTDTVCNRVEADRVADDSVPRPAEVDGAGIAFVATGSTALL